MMTIAGFIIIADYRYGCKFDIPIPRTFDPARPSTLATYPPILPTRFIGTLNFHTVPKHLLSCQLLLSLTMRLILSLLRDLKGQS